MSRLVHVAVGVIVGDHGKILIAKRPDNTHQGGLWEFPGGKVERNETVLTALTRELFEELAIQIHSTVPLIKICHDYGDKKVLLDVHKVFAFTGEPQGNEGQPIAWVAAQDLTHFEFPAANRAIISAVNLPSRYLITGEAHSHQEYLSKAEAALQSGSRLMQLRAKQLSLQEFNHLAQSLADLCAQFSARLQLNTSVDNFLALGDCEQHVGLHLSSSELMQLSDPIPRKKIVISASCHNEEEIEKAQKLGIDFICVSPVLATSSHPAAISLGWARFEEWVYKAKIPVYALGGMSEEMLPIALNSGAQGIAAIGAWW